MGLEQTKIPEAELRVLKKLPDLKVIFDVGARVDVDYIKMFPKAEFHLFEPNPEFFQELMKLATDSKFIKSAKVNLSNFGLGDMEEIKPYNSDIQSFLQDGNIKLPIRTLNGYVKKEGITKIDFLKIDTEGWDYRVLTGGLSILPQTKFIQYEHWNDKEIFHTLLERDFVMEYIGYRNVLCMNKKLVDKSVRDKIIKFIRKNKFGELV